MYIAMLYSVLVQNTHLCSRFNKLTHLVIYEEQKIMAYYEKWYFSFLRSFIISSKIDI
jgi:hypothetical protein